MGQFDFAYMGISQLAIIVTRFHHGNGSSVAVDYTGVAGLDAQIDTDKARQRVEQH